MAFRRLSESIRIELKMGFKFLYDVFHLECITYLISVGDDDDDDDDDDDEK